MKLNKYLAIATCAMLIGTAFAGSVNWRFYEDAGFAEDNVAYLFVGDGTGVADAITGGTFDPSSAIASGLTDEFGEIEQSGIGSFQQQTVSLYMVVFNASTVAGATDFIVSDPVSMYFGMLGDQTYNFTASFENSSWQDVNPTPGPGPDPVDPDPVPEPTSVALLALGLAAFGLKRKVA